MRRGEINFIITNYTVVER